MTTNQPGGGAVPPHLERPEVRAALEATRAKFALQQQRAQQQQQHNGGASSTQQQPQSHGNAGGAPAPLSVHAGYRNNPMFGEVRLMLLCCRPCRHDVACCEYICL